MYFKQFYLGCLAHASYLIGSNGEAVVFDPQRDVEQYIADATAVCCEIKYVFLTHFHADFLAGHIELRDKCGAKIYLGLRLHGLGQHAQGRRTPIAFRIRSGGSLI